MMERQQKSAGRRPAPLLAALLLCLTFFFVSAQPAGAATLAESGQRVYDYAGLLTAEQAAELQLALAAATQQTGMDIVFLSAADTGGKESLAYAEDFYDQNGFGVGESKDGIVYFIDMDHRVPTIATTGHMIDYISDNRLNDLFDSVDPYLQQGDWYGSATAFSGRLTYWVAQGLPEGGYRYDEETGQVIDEHGNLVGARKRQLGAGEAFFALAAGLLAGLWRYRKVSRSYRMQGQNYVFNLRSGAVLSIIAAGAADQFLRSSVTRVPITPPGAGSGGHGSSVHRGGSGTFHGGGSGRGF